MKKYSINLTFIALMLFISGCAMNSEQSENRKIAIAYGKFCGEGYPATPPNATKEEAIEFLRTKFKPKDEIDESCQKHDICYTIHEGDRASIEKICDGDLADQTKSLLKNFEDSSGVLEVFERQYLSAYTEKGLTDADRIPELIQWKAKYPNYSFNNRALGRCISVALTISGYFETKREGIPPEPGAIIIAPLTVLLFAISGGLPKETELCNAWNSEIRGEISHQIDLAKIITSKYEYASPEEFLDQR